MCSSDLLHGLTPFMRDMLNMICVFRLRCYRALMAFLNEFKGVIPDLKGAYEAATSPIPGLPDRDRDFLYIRVSAQNERIVMRGMDTVLEMQGLLNKEEEEDKNGEAEGNEGAESAKTANSDPKVTKNKKKRAKNQNSQKK